MSTAEKQTRRERERTTFPWSSQQAWEAIEDRQEREHAQALRAGDDRLANALVWAGCMVAALVLVGLAMAADVAKTVWILEWLGR